MNYQKKLIFFKVNLISKFSILNGAKYFSSGILQNYLVFIEVRNYIKYFIGTTEIASRKSNVMSELCTNFC